MESAYGDTQAIHPKVLSFEQPWNGYLYWMSFSPYPVADDSKENPHILASNDMEHWEEPVGYSNPLEDTPPNYIPSKIYNSDPCLVYNDQKNVLECWWRYVNDSEDCVIIYRSCSVDGINWDAKEVIISEIRSTQDYVSPCILYEDGLYKMWSVGNGYRVQYTESRDLINWSPIRFIEIHYTVPTKKHGI